METSIIVLISGFIGLMAVGFNKEIKILWKEIKILWTEDNKEKDVVNALVIDFITLIYIAISFNSINTSLTTTSLGLYLFVQLLSVIIIIFQKPKPLWLIKLLIRLLIYPLLYLILLFLISAANPESDFINENLNYIAMLSTFICLIAIRRMK